MVAWGQRKKRNPADAAAAVYEDFHGKRSSEIVTVKTKIHYHEHLAALGELEYIIVRPVDGRGLIRLKNFKGAILCTNEDLNQLFIEGGNQKVDPSAFGIRTAHETETLGQAVEVGYFTTKKHLGRDGGTAVYEHKFGTTNKNGKHISVKLSRPPDLIYRVRDELLEFSGGSYAVRAEGIDL